MDDQKPDDKVAIAAARIIFEEIMEDAWVRFLEKYPKKGISFQVLAPNTHYLKMDSHIKRLSHLLGISTATQENRRQELIDMLNYCWMTAYHERGETPGPTK